MLPKPTAMDIDLTGRPQEDALRRKLEADRLQQRLQHTPDKDAELREACEGFESIFLNKLWSQMRKSVPKEGFLHSKEEEFYQSMFDQEMAKKMSQGGGIGLADMLHRQLREQAELVSRATSPPRHEDPLPIDLASGKGPATGGELPASDVAPLREASAAVPAAATAPASKQPLAASDFAASGEASRAGNDPLADLYSPVEQSAGGLAADAMYEPLADGTDGEDGVYAGAASQDVRLAAGPPATTANAAAGGDLEPALSAAAGEPLTKPQPLADKSRAAPQGEYAPGALVPPRLLSGAPMTLMAGQTAAAPAQTAFMKNLDADTRQQVASLPLMTDPTNGPVSSSFGWRNDPFTGKRAWHAGVDYAAPAGAPIKACWDGEVVFSGEKPGYGAIVVLEHAGGWRSFYGHAGGLQVNVGDAVRAGQEIAEVGSSGRATGPHLHFEIRREGRAFDPEGLRQTLLAMAQ